MNLFPILAFLAASEHTAEGLSVDHWVVISTIALTIVTAVTALLMVREAFGHSAKAAKTASLEKSELTEVIHEIIAAEHEEEMARLDNKTDEPDAAS